MVAVETKNFAPKWVDLPAPGPITAAVHGGSNPNEPGIYEFAYSLIDVQGNTSPISDPIQLDCQLRNWDIMAKLPNAVPLWVDACGWVLWSRRVSPFGPQQPPAASLEFDWKPCGGQANCGWPNVTRPIMPMAGVESHTLRGYHQIDRFVRWYPGGNWPSFEAWGQSTLLGKPPGLPDVQLQEVPNRHCKVAIAFVGNEGESPLSQTGVIEPINYGGDNADCNSRLIFRYMGQRPQGALGFHVYVQYTDTPSRSPWIRQKAPHGDGYLWPITLTHFTVASFDNTGPKPVGGGRSLLAPIQQALEATNGNVLVTEDQVVYSPVINDLYNGHGSVTYRDVQAPHGFRWNIRAEKLGSGSWPVWVEAALGTRLNRLTIWSDHASAGIDFLGYSDSSVFSFAANGLNIYLGHHDYSTGIIQREDSRSNNNHTCSEPRFHETVIQARHPVVVEGNQSANWKFTGYLRLALTGEVNNNAALELNNWGSVKVLGEMTVAGSSEGQTVGGRALVAMITTINLTLENVFIDQGFPTWFAFSSLNAKRVDMSIEQTNQWASRLNFIEHPNGCKAHTARVTVTGTFSQHNNPIQARAIGGRVGQLEYSYSPELTVLGNMQDTSS